MKMKNKIKYWQKVLKRHGEDPSVCELRMANAVLELTNMVEKKGE